MLRHLAAMDTVRETGPDTFAPTALSNAFAEPAYQDSILYIFEDFQPVHQATPSFFHKHGFKSPDSGVDGPFQHTFNCKGDHYFEYFPKHNPEMGRRFASMMEAWSKGRPRWFQEEYYPVRQRLIDGADKGSEAFLVDVGGGTGHDIEGLLQAFGAEIPGKLVLQERPEIIEIAQVSPEVQTMAHDFLTEQPVKGKSLVRRDSSTANPTLFQALARTISTPSSKTGPTRSTRRSSSR